MRGVKGTSPLGGLHLQSLSLGWFVSTFRKIAKGPDAGFTPIIPALRRLRLEDGGFQASLGYK
jgi:hypothetical protein